MLSVSEDSTIYLCVVASICLVFMTIILTVLVRIIWIKHSSRQHKQHPTKIEIETTMFTDLSDPPDTIITAHRRPIDEVSYFTKTQYARFYFFFQDSSKIILFS